MGRFLSDRELARTIGAETRAPSPLPTAIVSNGGYDPPPQSPQQKQVQAEMAALGDRCAARLGSTRRGFLASSAGSMHSDQLERVRARRRVEGRLRSNLAYGYVAR
ncbi:MAG TPA: hypothetical protein VIA64_00830 [Burkholderiales bacterium]|jgi:hypothetical protein